MTTTELATTPTVQPGSGDMFDQIAPRYDLLNRLMSLGIDQGWRRKTVAALDVQPGDRVLDMATGTADIALQIAARYADAQVIGVDPSANMLEIGRRKATSAGVDERVSLVLGDAREIPFADGYFAGVTMAFGIRNVPAADRRRAVVEMARVTRPGGRIAILELSEPRGGIMGPLARFHVHTIVPWVGGLLSGKRQYRYLQKSIEQFPPPAEFAAVMTDAGLVEVAATPLTFGVCCLFVGTVPTYGGTVA